MYVLVFVIFVNLEQSGGSGPDSFQGTWMNATLDEFNANVMVSQVGAVEQGENIFTSLVQILTGYPGHVWHNHTLLNFVITWLMHLRPIDFVFLTKVSCSKALHTKQCSNRNNKQLAPPLLSLPPLFLLLVNTGDLGHEGCFSNMSTFRSQF